MAQGLAARSGRRTVPKAARAPLAMIGVFALLAVTFGLFTLSTNRDESVARAVDATDAMASSLLEQSDELQSDDAADLLARAVLATEDVRAAAVWLGDASRVVSVGPDAPTPTQDLVDEAAATGEPVVQQRGGDIEAAAAFARVDGAPVVLVTRTPVRPLVLDWTGIALGWVAVALSIAVTAVLLERRRRDRVMTLEETVQALYAHDTQVTRQHQELLQSKTEFVNAISQELRTPLEVIKGVAGRLATGEELSERQRRDLVDGLQLNADRLDVLLGDLIDVDRLTQRTVSVHRRPVRLEAAVRAALRDVDVSQHEVRVDVGDVTAQATPGHVERILRCLVHNAVKFAPAGSTVEIGAVRDGPAVMLGVDDEGPGIPAGDRIAVFEPLRQLADDPGMGLGLALVKRFAELHGGRAWVEESPSGGAAFRVLLPDEGAPVRVDPWRVAEAHAATGPGAPVGAP